MQTNIKLPIQKAKCYDCRGYWKKICYYNLFEDFHNFCDIDTDSAEETNCSQDNPEVPMLKVDHVNDEIDSVQDEHEVQVLKVRTQEQTQLMMTTITNATCFNSLRYLYCIA